MDDPAIADELARGAAAHRAGRLSEAGQIYAGVIGRAPDNARALHALGLIAFQSGRTFDAVPLVERSVRADPGNREYWFNFSQVLRKAGDAGAAIEAARGAVRVDPAWAEGHANLGDLLAAAGRWAEAAESYRTAVAGGPHERAGRGLGVALAQSGRPGEAVPWLRATVAAAPADADAWHNLGTALLAAGDAPGADDALARAVAIRPTAQTHVALASARERLGAYGPAVDSIRAAVALRPDFVPAYVEGAAICRAADRSADAVALGERATRLAPGSSDAWRELGAAHLIARDLAAAERCLREAARLAPGDRAARRWLARVYEDLGAPDRQIAELEAAVRGDGGDAVDPADQIALALALPTIYATTGDVGRLRGRMVDAVDRLVEAGVTLDVEWAAPFAPFRLAYQGMDDRPLMERIARLYRAPQPQLPPPPARPDGRVRVAFVSRLLHDHTIGRLNAGLIAALDRRAFDVAVVAICPPADPTTAFLRARADRYIAVGANLPAARRAILDLAPDVLFYTDVGMDPGTYALAMSRLAPVQCTTWGHPVTTGLPTMDYFVSAEALETGPEAQAHYTERLVRLPHLAVRYDRPPDPGPLAGRGAFPALPPDRRWYACPQSLFKLHPAHDAVLGEVLRRDPGGVLVLIDGMYPAWRERLTARLRAAIPDVADRVRFVPRMGRQHFAGLCAAADVLLDPPGFGGGNSTYEALAVGAPVVTLPSEFLRGRITAALARQAGVTDGVATDPGDYAARAVRLATDRDLNSDVRRRTLAAGPLLFENDAGVRDLEAFLLRAVDDARRQ